MRWNSAGILVAGVMGLAFTFPSAAIADRQYPTCGMCNAKCHGICFMNGDGCFCSWGSQTKKDLKTRNPIKSDPALKSKGTIGR